MAFSIDLAPVAVANGAGTFYGCRPCLFGVTSSWAGRVRSELRRSRSNSRRQPELRGDLNSPADAPLCSPRLACIRGDAPLNVNVSGHTLTFCVSSTVGAIDEGLRSNPALDTCCAITLERFPKRLNLEGFPYGHESDSRFALERRPVWDGEAVFGGFAYARGEGGGGGRHDTGNCGVPRCEYQLCGPLS